jgi:hypothetical protein
MVVHPKEWSKCVFWKSLKSWTCYPKPYWDEFHVIVIILASISYLDVVILWTFFLVYALFSISFFFFLFCVCVFGLHVLHENLIFEELGFYGNISSFFKGISHFLMRYFVFMEVFFINLKPLTLHQWKEKEMIKEDWTLKSF